MYSQQMTSLVKTKRCTGGDVFSTVSDFFNKTNVLWKNCADVTTDGAAALTRIKKGFQGKITEIAPHQKLIHCIGSS